VRSFPDENAAERSFRDSPQRGKYSMELLMKFSFGKGTASKPVLSEAGMPSDLSATLI
jgi:hypothetical protein